MKDEYPLPFHEINPSPKKQDASITNDPAPIILLLDGIANPRNLGSLFRLADACGLKRVYGYHIGPFSNLQKIDRVARQTTGRISFEPLHEIESIHDLFKQYHPIALEYTNLSVPFQQYDNAAPCVLVIGNERQGVSKELLELCQTSLHIPMLGQNRSMNVAVATGIVLYHLLVNMGKL